MFSDEVRSMDPDAFWENDFYLKQYFSTGNTEPAEVFSVTNISHIFLKILLIFKDYSIIFIECQLSWL